MQSFGEMSEYLKTIGEIAGEISEGKLGKEIDVRSDHDNLGQSFQKMMSGLKDIVIRVRQNSQEISSSSSQLAAMAEESSKSNEKASTTIEEITATMHEMATTLQSVAKNIQSQASSVTETSSSVEQMVTSIQRVAENVKRLVEITQNSLETVIVGRQTVEKASSGMEEINKVTVKAADTIGRLGSKTDDIGRIVEVIDDIAEQTNLLALNAAIEAARAGEQGMGFAVVAEEVRKLAERSARSTREIADLINAVTKEAQVAVSYMEKNAAIVEQGLTLSREVNQTLQRIEDSVAEVSKYSEEIGAATMEQSSGSEQIGKAVTNLNEITQELSTAAEEQSSSADQVVRAIEKVREMIQQNSSGSVELASSAEQLSRQAKNLQEIVEKFSLNGKGN